MKMIKSALLFILTFLFFVVISFKSDEHKIAVIQKGNIVSIENEMIKISFNLSKGTYSAIDKKQKTRCISDAYFKINQYISTDGFTHNWTEADVADELGTGKKLIIRSRKKETPDLNLEIILYDTKGFFVVNNGVFNTTGREFRIMGFSPVTAKAFEGNTFSDYKTLDGESGSFQTHVSSRDTLNCHNNLLVTFGGKGKPKNSLVIGGLTYNEFQKFVHVDRTKNYLNISVSADDPVGKLVTAGTEYVLNDKFYIDFVTNNRFQALENYGFALHDANHCRITGVDYPILNMWYVQWEHGGHDVNKNNTPGSIWAMEDIAKTGFLKYCKVGVRLEPDDYSYPNNQQGWWNDKHWQQYPSGGFQDPYETAEEWGKTIRQLGGEPFIYFQTAKRSEDYCKTYPEHVLFNDPFKSRSKGGCGWWNDGKGDQCWSYDFTDPGFIQHMKGVYQNLKTAGVKGVKFDYPETGWAYDGGFEDKYATTASAYRNIYKLAYKGLGENCDIQERLPENGDIALGVITSIRSLGDGDFMFPPFAAKTGLRWYKNRVAVNYDLDAKNPFHGVPENSRDGVRAMYTMTYLTTGRLELGKYFSYMSKEQLYDLSRVVPFHNTPKSPRPVDAFSGVEYPQVYDFEVNPGWHLLTFYNTAIEGGKWPVHWPEWYEPLKGIPVQSVIKVNLGDATDDGGIGLDAKQSYFIWDFWNWQFVGKFSGSEELKQTLRPGEARVFAVHEKLPFPQFISTNRHIMQGYTDIIKYPVWDQSKMELSGISKVIGGEIYKIIIALNGFKPIECSAGIGTQCDLKIIDEKNGLIQLSLSSSENKVVGWHLNFKATTSD